MKAFEEWTDRTYYEWDTLDPHTKMEIAWKAALEWVLDTGGGNCDWDKIEKELEP